ncbi:MAG: protein adenylyltransferase SelO family protein, partial [Alsobacter sp.]
MTVHVPFDNSYARLPEGFFVRVQPAVAPAPRLLLLNRPLAVELGLDPAVLEGPDGVAMLSGARPPVGAEPIAMAYAGHQFGSFVP